MREVKELQDLLLVDSYAAGYSMIVYEFLEIGRELQKQFVRFGIQFSNSVLSTLHFNTKIINITSLQQGPFGTNNSKDAQISKKLLQNIQQMEADQYEHESECEDYADYGPEGYHPVQLGQKFNGVYTVVQKLGWGHFSTVWLVLKETTKEYLALKIQRSKESHTQSAIDELEMLSEVRKHETDPEWIQFLNQYQKQQPKMFTPKLCRPLLLVDNFAHFGIHGKHMCTVFELMGPNLLDLIQHYEFKDKRMPLWLIKKITRDVLMGLVYLHERCRIIHTDLKPENIMIKMEPYEQQQLIDQLKNYKIKPISMKYLKNLQAAKNPKNKKKQEKKKLKKKKLQEGQEDKDEVEEDVDNSSKNQAESESKQGQSNPPPSSSISEGVPAESFSQSSSPLPSPHHQNSNCNSMVEQSISPEVSSSSLPVEKIEQKREEQNQHEWQDIQDGVDMGVLVWKNVKIQLNNKLFFKIVDMGNACFADKHFTEDIQTREYRSPEVILGYDYFYNTDVFSLGCVVFEMLTNNFLFKPKKISGIKKNEDHIYQMLERLGPIDKDFAINGKYSSEVFNKKGKLLNGTPKVTDPISKLLVEKYDYSPQVAVAAQEFLLPMLAFQPKDRIDARTCLHSKWLWT